MRTATKRILSFMLALAMLISLVPAVTVGAKAAENGQVLYEEDFDDYGSGKITLSAGKNEAYNITVSSGGTAWIENGRLWLTGANQTAYITGGENWTNYTVEADVGFPDGIVVWGGVSYYVQSGTKWQKGSVVPNSGEFKLNGYDSAWTNNTDGVNSTIDSGIKNDHLTSSDSIRIKIVASGTKATLSYARYENNTLGNWTEVLTIDNIPQDAVGGSVGIVTGTGATAWIDNLKVTSNGENNGGTTPPSQDEPTNKEPEKGWATERIELLYKENFDSYGDVTLKSGVNEDVNLFVPSDTTAKIENGRLYLTGTNRTAYFLGGEMWSYYTVEADIGYISTEDYWGGLAFYAQSGTKWHKGNIRTKGEAKLNGYDLGFAPNGWVNDVDATNKVNLQDVENNKPAANEPIRLKIVAEGTKATMYYARYTDGVRGEYKKVIEINNIPASCQSGSVGLAAGNGKTVWMDNLVVTRNLDQEKAKHNLMSIDFDEYTSENTATLASGLNASHYNLNFVKSSGSNGKVELKDGRMYITGNQYDIVYFDWKDAQHWTDYVVEADMCYTASTGWNGLLYRVQEGGTSAQKGNLYPDGRVGLNGFIAKGNWANDSEPGYGNKLPAGTVSVTVNKPQRVKIVVKDKYADIYYAEYTNDTLGDWTYLFSIDDIPTDKHAAGSVGFMTSGGGTTTSYWVDNIDVYEYTNTYVEDFNRYSNTTLSTGVNEGVNGVGMEVVRTASGGTVQVKDGVLDFKAADGSSTDAFDAAWFTAGKNWTNYTFEADVTYKNGGELSNGTQWGTLLYRVADKTSFQRGGLSYPKRVYLGGYESGWNPNQENVDKWYLDKDLPKDEAFRVKLVVEDRASYLYYALYNENGDLQPYTFVKSIKNIPGTQSKGTVGMLGALGVNFQVDNVVVAAGKPQDPSAATPSYEVADINIPTTGIVNPPVVVMNVTKDNYSKIATDKPSVALMDIDSSMNIVQGTTVVAKAADFLTNHHATVIPAFRVDSSEEAQALITFLKENGVMDAFVVATSENAALIKTVRTACPKIRGILEYTSVLDTYEKQAASRRLACSNLATVVLVPEGTLDAGVVQDYNARVISIWSYASNKAGVYDAIAVGSNAVISADVGMVQGVYSGITETTISGIPMAIGHRGRETTTWPENTIMAFTSAHEECGAPIVELDVWLTGDDKVVVMHDNSLNRTTNGSGYLSSYSLENIQKDYFVKSGDGTKTAPIPSLEDVFKEFQNDDLVIYIQTEERTKPKLSEEVNRLVKQYNMQDKVVIFARYNNGAEPYYKNSDFGEDLPFIGGDSSYPSGTVANTVKTMIEYFAPYNHQGMPYNYNNVSGVSEDLYYAVTARGFVPIHSTSNGQSTLDNYLLTGYGCPGALTDFVEDISDYLVEIVAEDETLETGKTIGLTKTIKQIKGQKTMTCGVEWISGDALVASGDSYTMKNPGTATVVYYADVTLNEHDSQASYRLYSQPVDITFEGEEIQTLTLSILGDSISTYEDWSEGDAAQTTNSNIANNYLYYSVGELGVYLADTWWYQAAQELGMDILVNNSWSGSCVFQSVADRNNAVGAYIARAEQLHDDTGSNAGEEPDVIAFFMGTNDVNKYPSTMGTYDAVDFDDLIKKNADNSYTYAEPTTTIEAYAIALHKMINRYKDAEIYCFTLIQKDSKKAAIEQFNADVKKLAEKFGVYVVDLYNDSGIVADSFRTAYMGNENHPNPAGMDALTGAFTSAFYKNSKYMADDAVVYDVSYTLKDAIVDQGTAKAVLGGKAFERTLTTLTGRTLDVKVTMGDTDITDTCYADGKISIASVTGNIAITAEGMQPAAEPGDYRWEKGSDGLLATVTTGGFTSNPLTKLEGTVTNGVMDNGRYQLTTPVVLKKNEAWEIEWKGSGYTGSYMVFANATSSKADGVPFIFFHPTSHFVALGSWDGTYYQNYCGVFTDINFTGEHVYRMNNVVTDSGNMVYLSIDFGEAKPMNAYYQGTTSQGSTGIWAGGQDYTFTYMGTTNHPIDGVIEYVQVRANVVPVSSIAVTTSPKTAYYVGDTLDVTGGKLTLTYADQSTYVIDLTADMVSGFDSAATGSKTLTVTYEGKTTTYTVQVSEAPAAVAGKYRWELTDTGLVSVVTDGNTRNDLTKQNSGTVSDGKLGGISYQLTTPVVLEKDKDWYIEWKTTSSIAGTNSSLLFSNASDSKTPDNVFIFLRPESHLVAIGSYDGTFQNYGIEIPASVAKNQTHKYRLQNELSDDGNMVYLYIDDVKIGAMTGYFVGGTPQNSSGQWVAGVESFTFNYMGSSTHALYGDLSYVQVWQGEKPKDELGDAVKAAEAAQAAAEEAQAKAEAAQAAAETAKADAEKAKSDAEKAKTEAAAAQAAAEAAATTSGANSAAAAEAKAAAEKAKADAAAAQAAAEAAQAKSEEAQTEAEAAKAAAETAKTGAETAAAAAEQSNQAAAAEAAKAAQDALKAADEASKAATEAAKAVAAEAATAKSAAEAAASAAAAAASASAAEASKVAAEAAQKAAETAKAEAEAAKAAAESAQAKSEEAQGKAETAQAAAEAAQAEAEAAQTAAEAAEKAAGEDASAAANAKAAAEAAQAKAEAAQAAADAAKVEAEAAKTAAETAQSKAEEAQTGAETAETAAKEAAAAAEKNNTEAAKAAADAAADAAKTAKDAADVAQAAEKVATDSANAAASAAASAESAKESAGFAADAAEAAKEAQEAQKAAEEAQAKAEAAQKAAEEERLAAEAAQKAAEEERKAAEEARKAAEAAALVGAQYQSVLTIDSYAEKIDQSGYTQAQIENLAKVVSEVKAAIGEAKTVAEVAAAVEEGKAAIDAAAVEIETSNTAATISRIYGENRFETALQMADEMKTLLGKDKLDAVIIASGLDFADALSGSYLAVQKEAPILLINNKASKFEESKNQIADYIRKNLAENGTVYILGGEKAVPAAMEDSLTGYQVKRLAGANRYETNLVILAETGLGNKELLISTGTSFADSVSASATGRPILMVGKKLLDAQTQFLSTVTNDMVILGGTAAVSEKVEAELARYGNVKRIGGANRFETSVLISQAFFQNPTSAVLAYARTYPDALCSGPVAYLMNAPILLSQSGNSTANSALTEVVEGGLVIGGPKLISDATVRTIFGLSDDYLIIKK